MRSLPRSTKSDSERRARTAAEVVLIFDTDGTLLDGREAVIDAVAEGLEATYRHFHLPVPEISKARIARAIGLPSPRFFRASYEPQTVPADLRDRFAGEYELRSTRAEVAALERGSVELYEGTEETLAALSERGHPMALFSNSSAPYFEAVVRAHGLDRYFRHTLSLETAVSSRVARDKSGIVRHFSADHGDAVVIGDRVHDIEAGRTNGARTVGCLYGFGDSEEFESADWTVGRLPEILELPIATPTKRA